MGKLDKTKLINKLRHDANEILKICDQADSDKSVTAEELEKRISKAPISGSSPSVSGVGGF